VSGTLLSFLKTPDLSPTALAESKNVYTDAEDLQLLERQGAVMRGNWTDLRKSEGDAEDSD
jgi:hypothetical protein